MAFKMLCQSPGASDRDEEREMLGAREFTKRCGVEYDSGTYEYWASMGGTEG